MPRKPAVIPNYELKVCLSQDLYAQLAMELWSEVEGRVPHGAWKAFFEARLREWFAHARFDLSEIIPGIQPGTHYVTGDNETINLLRRHAHADTRR